MKHNPTFYVGGQWWVVETMRTGEKFAVSQSQRIPYGELVAIAAQAIKSINR